MEKRKNIYSPKRVLILGNGFDLAHSLPTRYSDFLKFCFVIEHMYTFNYNAKDPKASESHLINKYINPYNIDSHLQYELININRICFKECSEGITLDNNRFYAGREIYNCINTNIWYEYLKSMYEKNTIKGENWIDFESEISFIIETIDKCTKNIAYLYSSILSEMKSKTNEFSDKINLFNSLLKKYEQNSSVKEVRKNLYIDLENLVQALEIYLNFVERIPINVMLKDITDPYDYVINFNYTHTYKKVYGNFEKIFYIHGEINKKPNNMVLGIDEYWSEEEQDKHTNFTIFKKFAQRIQKRTGIESYKWFDAIKSYYNNRNEVSEVFIFGHSLDVTDKDILYDYLESEATSVTIYCKDKETEGEYIANVIKIIGEKRLLEKVNQYPPKLKFVIQQPMVSNDEKKKQKTYQH